MSINLDDRYPGRANGKTLSYPQGSFKNRTSPTSKDGTFLEQDWANDWAAFFQSLMLDAGIAANNTVDTVGASQYFDALKGVIQNSAMLVLPSAPASRMSSTIYAEDREQILRWKTLGAYTGYVSPDVGCISFGTQPDPRPFEVDLIGQTLDKTNPKYAALHAWGNAMGRFVAAGSWTAGTYFFCEMGGNLFRVPDLRNMFIRFTGTDIDTANARVLGSKQGDATRNLTGKINARFYLDYAVSQSTGVFYGAGNSYNQSSPAGATEGSAQLFFDASRQVPTSTENRTANTALHPRMRL